MSKFSVGDRVVLFNSISCNFEQDEVFGVLFVPVPVEGKEQHREKGVAQQLADGEVEVREQCQTLQHQIVDAGVLFKSEEEARAFYLDLLKK